MGVRGLQLVSHEFSQVPAVLMEDGNQKLLDLLKRKHTHTQHHCEDFVVQSPYHQFVSCSCIMLFFYVLLFAFWIHYRHLQTSRFEALPRYFSISDQRVGVASVGESYTRGPMSECHLKRHHFSKKNR